MKKLAIATKLQAFWQSVFLFFASRPEPRIQQVTNRDGETSWFVFDPISEQRHHFSSVAEVRAWLDQRYHDKRYS